MKNGFMPSSTIASKSFHTMNPKEIFVQIGFKFAVIKLGLPREGNGSCRSGRSFKFVSSSTREFSRELRTVSVAENLWNPNFPLKFHVPSSFIYIFRVLSFNFSPLSSLFYSSRVSVCNEYVRKRERNKHEVGGSSWRHLNYRSRISTSFPDAISRYWRPRADVMAFYWDDDRPLFRRSISREESYGGWNLVLCG